MAGLRLGHPRFASLTVSQDVDARDISREDALRAFARAWRARRVSGLPSPLWGGVGEGGGRGGGENEVRGIETQRLKSCRSTSFIGWLSGEGGGSLCGGADGASGVGEFGGMPRLWWAPSAKPLLHRM